VLPQAAAGRPTGAGNPEGQRLLTEAAAALRATHVEFAHQAHQDLLEVGGWVGGAVRGASLGQNAGATVACGCAGWWEITACVSVHSERVSSEQ
jgi:hypothetical protein